MNALLHQEVLRLLGDSPQAELPLACEGVQRYVWESRFGAMLIEVSNGVVYVNGSRVDRFDAGAPSATSAQSEENGSLQK